MPTATPAEVASVEAMAWSRWRPSHAGILGSGTNKSKRPNEPTMSLKTNSPLRNQNRIRSQYEATLNPIEPNRTETNPANTGGELCFQESGPGISVEKK